MIKLPGGDLWTAEKEMLRKEYAQVRLMVGRSGMKRLFDGWAVRASQPYLLTPPNRPVGEMRANDYFMEYDGKRFYYVKKDKDYWTPDEEVAGPIPDPEKLLDGFCQMRTEVENIRKDWRRGFPSSVAPAMSSCGVVPRVDLRARMTDLTEIREALRPFRRLLSPTLNWAIHDALIRTRREGLSDPLGVTPAEFIDTDIREIYWRSSHRNTDELKRMVDEMDRLAGALCGNRINSRDMMSDSACSAALRALKRRKSDRSDHLCCHTVFKGRPFYFNAYNYGISEFTLRGICVGFEGNEHTLPVPFSKVFRTKREFDNAIARSLIAANTFLMAHFKTVDD